MMIFYFDFPTLLKLTTSKNSKKVKKKRPADVTMRRGCDRPEVVTKYDGEGERDQGSRARESGLRERCSALKSTNVKYEERERERRDVLSSFYQIVRHIGDNFFGKYLFCRAKMKLHAASF